jgi:iron complex outermembrane recepter protein
MAVRNTAIVFAFGVGGSCLAGAASAQPTTVEPPMAAASAASNATLQSITVTGIRQKATATKQDAELRDLPQSVAVIPEQTIQDRAYTRIEDIANSVVNLQANAPYTGGVSIGFFSRGFNGSATLVDGYNSGLIAGFQSNIFELVSYDKLEVLRGPASVLYGQGNPGGVLNLTLKRPLPHFGFSGDVLVESTGKRRGQFDANTPLAQTLSLRTVAVIEDSDTFRDFGKARRAYVSPALRWQPTARTTVDAVYAYGRNLFNNDRNFSAYRELVRDLPVERNLSEPWLPLNRVDVQSLRLEAAHRLSDDWTLTAGYFENRQVTKEGAEIGPSSVSGTTVERYYIDYPNDDNNRSRDRTLSVRAQGRAELFGMRHRVLAGAEHVRNFYVYEAFAGEVGPIDYQRPVYSAGPLRAADTFEYAGGGGGRSSAIYVNDLIDVSAQWKLQLGLRHDRITSEGYSDAAFTLGDRATYRKTTPSVGIVWQPGESTSLYASYTTSFLPQFGRNRFGSILKPEQGKSIEVGLKQELLDRRLALTAAVFDIRKSDILTIDPVDPCCNLNGGSARSRGAELELQGRPRAGTELSAGIGVVNAKWTQSNDFPVGARLVGASPRTAVLSIKQDIGAAWLPAGTWLSAAANYGSKREWLPTIDEYKLPAYTRLDLAANVPLGAFELQFNLKNATDERIVLSNGYGLNALDTPRTIGVSLRYKQGAL